MSDKKTTTIAIDLKLWKMAKAHNLGIGQCAERGIKLKLGISDREEKIEKKIAENEAEIDYLKSELKDLRSIKADETQTRVKAEQKHEKAIKECLSYHTEEYGLGRDKITDIALKYDIEPEILIAEMEANPELKIEPFHMEIKETTKSTFV